MDSKTHMIGGLQFFSVYVIILWLAIPAEDTPGYLPGIALVLWGLWFIFDQFRIIQQNRLQPLKSAKKKKGKTQEGTSDTNNNENNAEVEAKKAASHKRNEKILEFLSGATYSLSFSLVVYISVLCNLEFSDRFGILFLGFLLAFIGSFLPDLDLWFDISYHRDPFTHSAMIVSGLFLYFFFGFTATPSDAEILFMVSGLLIGYSSHLLFDLYPFGSNLLDVVKKTVADRRTAPGDIRRLPEDFERPYLLYAGLSLIGFSIFLLFKILASTATYAESLNFWAFDPINGSNPLSAGLWILLISLIVIIIMPFVILVDNWNLKKPKTRWNWILLQSTKPSKK